MDVALEAASRRMWQVMALSMDRYLNLHNNESSDENNEESLFRTHTRTFSLTQKQYNPMFY